jgi:hypothetical protein
VVVRVELGRSKVHKRRKNAGELAVWEDGEGVARASRVKQTSGPR